MNEEQFSDAVMEAFGFDPLTGSPVREFGWRPVEEMTAEELEAELIQLDGDFALEDEIRTVERVGNDPAFAAEFFDRYLLGLPEGQRLHSEVTPNLETQALALFGLADDLVEVPVEQIRKWEAQARSFGQEVERSLSEQRDREQAARAERDSEVDRLWPM